MELDRLKQYLDQTWETLEKNELKAQSTPILLSNDPGEIKSSLERTLPLKEDQFSNVLDAFSAQILPYINRNTDPRFGAYITGSGNRIAAIAEFIKAFYNQNGLKWNNSPIASELEQLVIHWVAKFVHLPHFNKGVLTSGGSMSNLMSLHFALAAKFPEREMAGFYGDKPLTVYCSTQTHSSIDRAMVFLGLGRDHLRKIDVEEDYRISISKLRNSIDKDLEDGFQPLAIVGNAGTTNTGSIDPLDKLADLSAEYNLWYHVDGAYGLPAIRLPDYKHFFEGVELADSVIINPHKWMYVPFEASCVLLKSIPKAIHYSPDYLFTENADQRWESSEHTIELSKEFRALKVWFTMKYYGADQLTHFVEHDILMTNYLGEQISALNNMVVDPDHPLSILCFRYSDPDLSLTENDHINTKMIQLIESRGNIFITGTRLEEKIHLRVYFGNPERKKEDVDRLVDEIKEVNTQVLLG
ncbi:MAG: pyridoxal-dependent decarboxylase [Bacteroidota bacterium]